MNYAFSDKGEREERGIKKTTKKMMWHICLFFGLIGLFYNGLIILGPYFRGLKFL
jgi:hypothetical protein